MNVTLLTKPTAIPRLVSFNDLMEEICSQKMAKKTDICRRQAEQYLSADSFSKEKNGPVVLFSSLYKKQKNEIRWAGYTGYVWIKVVGLKANDETEEVKRKAADCLLTVAAFRGEDGQSVHIVTRFTRPDGSLPTDREDANRFHAHARRKAVDCYRLLLGKEICWEQGVVDEKCRLAYDPSPYYAPQAVPVTLEQPLEMPADEILPVMIPEEKKESWMKVLPGEDQYSRLAYLFDTVLRETVREAGEELETNAEAFLIRLAENCFRSGIPEEEAVKRIRFYSRLGVYEERVRSVVRNIYLLEKGFESRPAIPAVQLLALQMEEFMTRRYELRRNVLKKNVEYRERAALLSRFYPVTDEALNTISLQAHLEGLNFWDRDVKRYICSNRIAPFNPIGDYLDKLPAWDGKDHIGRLAATLPTDNPHWPLCFRRWLFGMVAQWKGMNRRHANCLVPLLSGPQSTGKSSWCKRILPPELHDYYTESIDMTSRRNAEMGLNRFALINLDEFDSIPESKQPLLKHLLQLPEVALRRHHSSQTEVLPRYASFIATCNPMEVLTDPTGSRRYLGVEVKGKITFDQFIDYPQLYAQAVTALRAGERYWLDQEEEFAITQYNDAFARTSPEEQLLLTCFQAVDATEPEGEWLSAMEILAHLQRSGKIKTSRTTMTSFGSILRKHNFLRKHTRQGNFYRVALVKEERRKK